ncbi:TMV resistance protein N-like protein, partial [Tanacetum coccineum]
MASSSVPTTRSGWTYDVFLSFRGEDTRNSFIDHLYAALVQKGIHTFKDDEMLHAGKTISQELMKAIEESKSTVVVFSENFANSSWCLDELVKIMECWDQMRQKVIPVFYHVDPSDVRKQKGNFKNAFQELEEKFKGDMDKVSKWREALTIAANSSGYHISAESGGEHGFVNKIVQEILGNIQACGRETNLIGIESHMDVLNSLLDIETTEEVRIVGIYGMGGIGKTTIAQALFRRIAYKFEGSSFMTDVRENSSTKKDLCALQEKILGDILVTRHRFKIQDPENGADMIQDRFHNKKVLLVLDDVDDVKQLEFLAATHDWFGPGSRIIITTRDMHLLSDANAKYNPALLSMDQAVELFSRHAFRKLTPPVGYIDLSYRAIGYTGWKKSNRVSKDMLGMHDLIQEMGWQIVCESAPSSKLWCTDVIHDLLRKNRELDVIEAISVINEYDEQGFCADVFESMSNLRLLEVDGEFTCGEPTILPDDLRWLCWEDYPFSSLPAPDKCNIVGMEMRFARIERLWEGQKHMVNLKFINLESSDCLIWFPDVSGAPNLKCLPSRLEMESLETFDLSFCESLGRFPELSPCMVKLSHIDLFHRRKIEELPSSIKYLLNLSYLRLSGCTSLMNIPNSICELKCLKSLDLSYCSELQNLPDEFGRMENLQELHLQLPASSTFLILTNLCSLIKLDLSKCQIADKDFPEYLHGFSSLEELNLSLNYKLLELPASISNLCRLKLLDISMCQNLQNLHSLPSGIQVLNANNCTSLGKIEDLSKCYECLYKISLINCQKLLDDEANARYLDKMLKQCFLQKYAAVDGCFSIDIPG